MASGGEWCLIESDPGVFTELIRGFGVSGVQVEELWSLEDAIFHDLRPIHGLIFLFKVSTDKHLEGTVISDDRLERIFFAKQVITNACATQAIISILLNCLHSDLNLGSTLSDFREFCGQFDPAMKGLALSNSEKIREVHNSFARQQLVEFDESLAKKPDDCYHFVSYMPIDGRLIELDGLQEGPIDHGPIGDEDWMTMVRPVLQKRMDRYSREEIHFNLMAVVSDKKMLLERQLQAISSRLGTELPSEDDAAELARIRQLISDEERKRSRYRVENIRRRHNYIPFIIEMLKILAQKGQLGPLVEQYKQSKKFKPST